MSLDRKKIFLIVGAFFVLLLLVLTTVVISLKSKTKPISGTSSVTPPSSQQQIFNQGSISPSPTGESEQQQKILPFPKAEFASWSQAPVPSYLPVSVQIYTFKQTYTQDEVRSLAKKLSLSGTIEQNNDNLLFTEIDEVNNQFSTLIFNTKTNNFAFLSTKGVPLSSTPNKTVQEKVSLFLNSLFFDPTLSVTASYKKKDRPDITYFEIHRDWQKAGLPILNSIGLLNLPEDQPLSTLSLTGRTADIPKDSNIYQSSDNKNSLARQTDFNTITVGIKDKEEKLISLSSNLRQIQTNKLSLTSPISFNQAYLRLKNNQSESLLTIPSGTGVVSFDKVYPGNIAIAKKAIITESLVAYLEKPPVVAQSTLSPYFIFRGYAQLDSGYRVNFIATVPASETKTNNQVVLGEFDDRTPKQGTLSFDTPIPTQQPTVSLRNPPNQIEDKIKEGESFTPTSTSTSTPTSTSTCLSLSDFDSIQEVGGAKIGYLQQENQLNGYYVIPNSPNINMEEIEKATEKYLKEYYKTGQGSGYLANSLERLIQVAEIYNNQLCPTRISSYSPTIFLYAKENKSITVQSQFVPSYTDPPITDNLSWDIVIKGENNLSINSLSRPYLYYEYKPLSFNQPEKGWLIEKNNLPQLANHISSQLILNGKEKERLIFELNHAASDIKGNNLFIGLINQEELNQKLPLTITPNPDKIYRYHFYIREAKGQQQVQPPLLLPIKRSPFMILELGAVGE